MRLVIVCISGHVLRDNTYDTNMHRIANRNYSTTYI